MKFKKKYWLVAEKAAKIAGVRPEWLYAQMAHETAGFTSELCLKANNCAGITTEYDTGLPQPDGDFYYAVFDNLDHFAHIYGCILEKYGVFKASDLDEFVYILGHQADGMNWYTDSYENYLAGCRRWLAIIP